jgi:hypothetical protein
MQALPFVVIRARARIARDHYINHAVKQLPWHRLSAIGFEDLNGLKRGKSPNRAKNFRKAAAPWTYRRVNGSNVWHWRAVFCQSPWIREAPPEHVPLVERTIGATARERCFDVSPATLRAMPISSALETS